MALNFREMPTGGKRKKGDRVMRKTLPMNLQLFAEGGDGNGGQSAGGDNEQAGQQGNQNNQQAAGVDYDKIQAMLDNATAKKENAVLKSYFQQQGLSEDEISQAIATFKQNKQQQTQQQRKHRQLQQTLMQVNMSMYYPARMDPVQEVHSSNYLESKKKTQTEIKWTTQQRKRSSQTAHP